MESTDCVALLGTVVGLVSIVAIAYGNRVRGHIDGQGNASFDIQQAGADAVGRETTNQRST